MAVTNVTAEQDPFGEDSVRQRLVEFLGAQHKAATRVEKLKRFTVGFSWLTYGFEAVWRDAAGEQRRRLILRIGPPNGIFAPYKASLQFFAQQVLEHSGVPVPQVYWYSDASDLFDAPFFICEQVAGEAPIPWAADGREVFDDATRATLAEQFVGALAALHTFEWRDTPLAAVSTAVSVGDTALRQIEFWEDVTRRSRLRSFPAVAWALAWLRANQPVAPRIGIVHGDYRIGNFLEQDRRITAILDWELTHLGDPHEDIGFVCLRAWSGRSPYLCQLIRRDDLYRRYEELTGIKVLPESVRYYEVLNNFKLFAIHAAAAGCFEAGRFNDLRMPAMGAQIPRVLLQLEKMIEDLS
jgi:aminoglycoside phosphotransferase (APT) family kinase protein